MMTHNRKISRRCTNRYLQCKEGMTEEGGVGWCCSGYEKYGNDVSSGDHRSGNSAVTILAF